MPESIELTEEHMVHFNLLIAGLATLAEDMAQADDPFAKRLDDMLMRFVHKLMGTSLEQD